MIAVDTSVIVAAFASWHEAHVSALAVMAQGPRLPGPCALETYAVLTRLPPPHRSDPVIVRDFLASSFADSPLVLPLVRSTRLVSDLVAHGISGGAAYDAVVGLVVAHAGATLVTLDQRARPTYERIGVPISFLG
jgi:predicted nucleic acid-binding protein